ncbi:SusC/RagA family TonB-linked outer membrane protein [Pedobacter insulae]|uniref:TonB-linked outer membrane protein, SusC/RagA family n=1 Tax=Pedobacter insulae TaxID=414048 RepID=A0A1I2VXH7_9SPHI|nr:SusC/RagA family TonB-linked outer membrane protein [Pedobacter insulae]SFG92021.1 TonB-linked outer membrane protein, SusC/RagA family [Pedobacter insulae]
MNFYTTFNRGKTDHVYATILLKLKLTLILLITVILQASATSFAQITLNEKDAPLEQVIQKIRKQTGYDFFYSASILNNAKPITLKVNNVSVEEALKACFADQAISYTIEQKTIILRNAPERVVVTRAFVVTGRVLDEHGKPIPGASVKVKGRKDPAIATDKDGNFKVVVDSENDLIVISYVGYETREVKASREPLSIKLKESQTVMKDIVITGTGINRKKDSFTGTTAIFTGEELKAVGNNNIIQSLRTLDPSFLLMENNAAGSNPNVLPIIEVRGKSSIPSTTLSDQFGNDPNQPLFVLDGFPTTLQTIVDLDMNRVASVIILKDAASTALYGAQASNGVVVIETIRPKPGELRFTYTQDFRLELPDLSGYNMMNAAEKLEFERLSGRYIDPNKSPTQEIFLEQLYNDHLSNVKKGIDSYWLSEPLQNGYSTNSSINASGGDQAFTYNVGMNYRLGKGAMIGSGRDTYSGSINLTYRKKSLNLNNITYIRGYESTESPYGQFSTFVNTNPYFEKNNTSLFLEQKSAVLNSVFNVRNPLYDALLPQYNKTTNLEFQNNLNANFDLSKAFRLNGALQITKGNTNTKTYKSPEMSDFISTPTLRKGRYTDNRGNNFSYQANLMLTYQKVFAQKHVFNANWRNTISQNKNESYATTAEGFPEGNLGNPRFAYNYTENGSPRASNGIYRTINTTVTANYSFDNRYLADFTYRIDGSTAYGSNKQFSPYFAVGLGWNLHNEVFVKSKTWINSLRLTGNIGFTGNQNFGNISSISVFNYNSNTNYNAFGQGVSLVTLGNPNLEPQKTRQISTTLDFSLFNNRFVGYVNAYNKRTDPLIVPVDLPSSTGVFNFPYNVGNLTYNGIETKLTYFPIYNVADRVMWSIGISGSAYKSKYGGIGNSLNTLNKQQENNKTLLRYTDNNSAETIWAIQSMGIDPATGREIFLTKDGQYTFDYNTGNIVNVGNTVPLAEGVFTTNLRYKNFNFGVAFRYRLGGDVFNTVLYNKVENITNASIANNQDKRALYERWKNPGDVSQFKGVSLTSTTPISSRFVQNENSMSSESLNIGYTLENSPWIKSLGLKTLGLNIFGNDFLYASTIRRERGISYPYARTFAFSLKASF